MRGSDRRTGKGGRRRVPVQLIAGICAFAVGAAVFAWPVANDFLEQARMDDQIAHALQDGVSEPEAGAEAPAKAPKAGDEAYAMLREYNEKVRTGTLGDAADPWNAPASFGGAGALSDGIVGSVSVPRLGVTLPLYLGASQEHMALGAAVVAGTSAPLGEESSNCVIAAHRGFGAGMPMFRDIEDVRSGDVLTLETRWDTFVYRAVETRVIDPDDVDQVRVQEGRDLVTLLTCHPYTMNTQRYLVYFERVGNAGADEGAASALDLVNPVHVIDQAFLESDSQQLSIERWMKVAGLLLLVAVLSALVTAAAGGIVRRVRRRRAAG